MLPTWFPILSGINMGISAMLLLTGLVLLWMGRHWLKQSLSTLLNGVHWIPERWRIGLLNLLSKALDGLSALKRWETALPAVGLTVLVWLMSVLTMYFVLKSFDLAVRWQVALILSLAIYLSNFVPTPPALIGVVSAVTEVTLSWFGIARSDASVVGLVLNVILVGPLVGMGGAAAWLRFIRFSQYELKDRWKISLGLKERP
jgi:uncharacterized membrane protein YbhN (UPF0104 family)